MDAPVPWRTLSSFIIHLKCPEEILKNIVRVVSTQTTLSRSEEEQIRGFQYVHCVMHKCIMVKLGGKRIKYVKKHVNFTQSGGNLQKLLFLRNSTETAEIGGKFQICSRCLKRGHRKFWRMKIRKKFREKVCENFPRSLKICLEIGGNLKQGEMHHCLGGGGHPWNKLGL